MKKIPIISPSSAHLKKDDYTFFVLRKKESTLECTNKYKDIFCVVRDSYANLIHKDIENGCNLNENGNTHKNKSILPVKETSELFLDTCKKTKDNDKLSYLWHDSELPVRGDTHKDKSISSVKETSELFLDTCKKTKDNDKLSYLWHDSELSICDVTKYNPTNDKKDNYENNNNSVFKVTFNFELFKIYLMRFFAINTSNNILYVDNDDKVRLVQNETEFLELWQFAKLCSKQSKGVLLLVDFINNQDDDINKNKHEVDESSGDDQENSFASNSISSENFKSKESMSEVKQQNKRQHLNRIFNLVEETNDNKLNDKDGAISLFPNLTTSAYSKILTKSFDNMKLENTTPSNITSQDVLNNVPPTWFVQYMEQLKKDIITEVSNQIMFNVMENLNKCSMRSPICTESKDANKSENQSHRLKSKCNHQRNNLLTDQRRQYKRKKRDMLVDKIYSEHVDKPLINIIKSRKKQVKKFEEKFEYNSEPNEDKEEENVHNETYNASELMSNINSAHKQNDIGEKQIEDKRNSMSPNFLPLESSKENLYNEPNIFNGTKENGGQRMNCSITEYQMLDKKYLESTTCCCGSDIENISIRSDLSSNTEICDDYNEFELISMPIKYKTNTNCHKQKSPSKTENIKNIAHKEDDDEIVTDLLTFDLLPEISPASSVICIAENHFTANSNNSTSMNKKDLNNVSTYKLGEKEDSKNEDNINEKIHDTHLSNTLKKCTNNNSTNLTDNICSLFIKKTSKSIDENTNLLHLESKHNNTNAMKIDVNSSHTSYLTTEPVNPIFSDFPIAQHNCQAQTDLNDLTQSFHSHTTSITDNGVYGISETNTSNSHDYSKHSFSDCNKSAASKKNKIREQIKKDLGNKYLENNPKKEENKNVGHIVEETTTDSMPGTAEPIHILPETLVTGAFHFASIAYGTAREAIVRIRSNSKDDRLSYMKKTPRH
uniref:putative histone-lysine N-methyltransferase 1 n=1 Tax=Vespula vulgaris TaxID=7454 RepID=UPI002132ADEE|nr:putative histone-lysine N-methyltransferase 1 [Vespula vulgaris]